jgi:hypothetical protein
MSAEGKDMSDPREPGLLAFNRMKRKTSEFSTSAQAELNGFQNQITGEIGHQKINPSESPLIPALEKDLMETEKLISEIRERLVKLDSLFTAGSPE